MDDEQPSREEVIERTVFANKDPWVMERNMFPYQMPNNCEHWTLWAKEELTAERICEIVEEWLKTAENVRSKISSKSSCGSSREDDRRRRNNRHDRGNRHDRHDRGRRRDEEIIDTPGGYVYSWNYDDNNSRRTIEIPHVHIYLCREKTHIINDGRVSKESVMMSSYFHGSDH